MPPARRDLQSVRVTDRSEPHDERRRRLAQKAKGLRKTPGVYLMKDATGKVIYVGKASVLRNRVSSYFVRSADLGPKKQPMLDLVEDFEVLECEGEWEALLAEARLIKDTRPRFNERLTDDKSFPYLAITMRDEFPGVYITRAPTEPQFKQAKIYGPFTSVYALREAVVLLQRVFKYRTCTLDIIDGDPKNEHFRPCLLYAIGQCTAPCAGKISRPAYREDIDRFVDTVCPLDRAGAYTVDGPGTLIVTRYEGCYQNVLGLPIVRLDALLRDVGDGLSPRVRGDRARFL